MIKGQTYSNQLFENWAYRLTFDTLLDSNNGVLTQYGDQLEVTTSSNNIIVGSGIAVIQGGIIQNTSSLTLVPQIEANLYYSVVVEIDMSKTNTTSEFNQGDIKLISNSGGYPTLTKQDTIQGTGKYQYEIARFQTTSSAIQNLTDTRTYLNYNSLYQELQNAIDQIIQDGINAEQVSYDNTTSGLGHTNVQGAIDDLASDTASNTSSIQTMNSTITDIQNDLPQLLEIGDFVLETNKTKDVEPSVGYNTYTTTATFTKSGYQSLGLVGWKLEATVGQLTGSARTTAIGNGTVTIEVTTSGMTNGQNKGKYTFSILWVKRS